MNIPITVNGKAINYTIDKGYAVIDRQWQAGDVVECDFPMDVRRVVSRPEVRFNIDRVALQRGPLVYCVEGADNNGKAWNFVIPDNATISTSQHNVLSEPVIALKADVPVLELGADSLTVTTRNKPITAIPYYVWANRGSNEMQVWLPRKMNIKL